MARIELGGGGGGSVDMPRRPTGDGGSTDTSSGGDGDSTATNNGDANTGGGMTFTPDSEIPGDTGGGTDAGAPGDTGTERRAPDPEPAGGDTAGNAGSDPASVSPSTGADPTRDADADVPTTDAGATGTNADAQETTPSAASRNEQFGDVDWSMGHGGPGDEVERTLRQASRGYEAFAQSVGAAEPSTGVATNVPGVSRERQQPNGTVTRGLESATAGVANVANAPGGAVGVLEALEAGPFLARNVGAGGADVSQRARRRAQRVAAYAQENPAQFGGSLLGGLSAGLAVGGGAALRSATRASGSLDLGDIPSAAARELDPRVNVFGDFRGGENDVSTGMGMDDDMLGSGGAGTLYDPDALDEAMGKTNPGFARRARRSVERKLGLGPGESDAGDQVAGAAGDVRQSLEQSRERLRMGDRGQARLVPPGRERTGGDQPDAFTGYEPDAGTPGDVERTRKEIFGGGTQERMRKDVVERQLRQRRALAGDYEGENDPFGTSSPTFDDLTDLSGRSRGGDVDTDVDTDTATRTGALGLLGTAQSPQATVGGDADTGVTTDQIAGPRTTPTQMPEQRQPQGTDQPQNVDQPQETDQRQDTDQRGETDRGVDQQQDIDRMLDRDRQVGDRDRRARDRDRNTDFDIGQLADRDDQDEERPDDKRRGGGEQAPFGPAASNVFANSVIAPDELDEFDLGR